MRWSRIPIRAALAASVTAGVIACSDGPAAPRARHASDTSRPAGGGPLGGPALRTVDPWAPLDFVLDDGTYLAFDPVASTLRVNDEVLLLAPDARDSVRTRLMSVANADALAAQVLSTPEPPGSGSPGIPCRPEYFHCGPEVYEPNASAPEPLDLQGSSLSTGVTTRGTGTNPWDCRTIATTMAERMPHYRASRTAYLATLANIARVGFGYAKQLPTPAPPRTWWDMVNLFGGALALDIAAANLQAVTTQMNVLGALFRAADCFNRPWGEPVPPTVTITGGLDGGGGEGGGGGGSSVTIVCTWLVTSVGGSETGREFLGCETTRHN